MYPAVHPQSRHVYSQRAPGSLLRPVSGKCRTDKESSHHPRRMIARARAAGWCVSVRARRVPPLIPTPVTKPPSRIMIVAPTVVECAAIHPFAATRRGSIRRGNRSSQRWEHHGAACDRGVDDEEDEVLVERQPRPADRQARGGSEEQRLRAKVQRQSRYRTPARPERAETVQPARRLPLPARVRRTRVTTPSSTMAMPIPTSSFPTRASCWRGRPGSA